jgi:tRNA nucleotidyltransferase (CCA-adding enzyme)
VDNHGDSMSWTYLHRLAEAVKEEGGHAFIVGGAVRDRLMGIEPKDLDLEVFGLPLKSLMRICRRFGRVSIVGASFAVLKLQFPDRSVIDVSVPRSEQAVGTGHRDFEVTVDPLMSHEAAAERRDLTVNAISMDPLTESFVDPFHGRDDIESGILRHVGPRFAEDPLRVLRVIRFAAQLDFTLAAETFDLCSRMIREGMLESLPRERIEEEFRRLCVNGQPGALSRALTCAEEMGVLRNLFPELQCLKGVAQDPRYHAEGDCLIHTFLTVDNAAMIARRDNLDEEERFILCLAALAHDLGKAVTTCEYPDGRITAHGHDKAGIDRTEKFLTRLTANKSITEKVTALAKHHMRPLYLTQAETVTDSAIRRLARDVVPASLIDLSRLVEADTLAALSRNPSIKANAHLFLRNRSEALGVDRQPPRPFLQGRDLIRLAKDGILPPGFRTGGPHFGTLLKKIYDAQLDGEVVDKTEAISMAIAVLNSSSK